MLNSKQKSLTIDYTPLKPSVSIEVVGSVSGRQTYDSISGEFVPDYTLVPLTLYPRCNACDVDDYIPSKPINSGLTNMNWYNRTGGQKTPITEGSEYSITLSGDRKGELKVNVNSSVVAPLALEFTADYIDPRTSQTYVYNATFTVIVTDQTDAIPIVSLDSPSVLVWNPLRERKEHTITAKLISGSRDLTDLAGASFRWYHKNADGSLTAITNADEEFEVISVNKNVLKIDRDFIGDKESYVCRAHYSTSGSSVEPTNKDSYAITTIVRRIPDVYPDYKGLTFGVAGGQRSIRPIGYAYDNVGLIPNAIADDMLKFVWYIKKPSDSAYSKAAEGREPVIPMTDGMMLDLRVEDKGPQALIVDNNDNNTLITDNAGNPLYQREFE